jgi:hypothetical protein
MAGERVTGTAHHALNKDSTSIAMPLINHLVRLVTGSWAGETRDEPECVGYRELSRRFADSDPFGFPGMAERMIYRG